jgi:citrate-Mg2+:H+ or citrate-Ca2+:H+ symporter, CitMHS family
MVAAFIGLIMTRRLSATVALIVLPLIAGVVAGDGAELGTYVVDGIKSLAPTVVLLVFAILYFSVMIDVGLFDPVVRAVLRFSKADPVRIALGTVALTLVVSLDGDGASTILIVAAAFLALYDRLGMSRLVLATLLMVGIACSNLTPWGGPVTRAASALEVDPGSLFVPLVPSMIAGAVAAFGLAYVLGRRERARLLPAGGKGGTGSGGGSPDRSPAKQPAMAASASATEGSSTDAAEQAGGTDHHVSIEVSDDVLDRAQATRPRLLAFNTGLTVVLMTCVVLELWPLPVLFLVGFAVAFLVNYPSPKVQGERISKYAGTALPVVTLVFAAAVCVGVLNGTGMIEAMGDALVHVIPQSWGSAYGLLVGLLSLPLTFLLSNDAYYFGVLPVLAEAGAVHGLRAEEVARAALIGGPVHVLSPLVPALYLLTGTLDINLGELQRYAMKYALLISLVMLAVALAIGVIPLG